MNQFDTITYLKTGNASQQEVYAVLTKAKVMEKLSGFTPILTGTYPIAINIKNSDLDIICEYQDRESFITIVTDSFKQEKDFSINEKQINGTHSVIIRFRLNGFEVEVFGQPITVKQQNAYLHMIKEYEILQAKGEHFKQQIIDLKRKGIKTEPAFAMLLNIKGDPYTALLQYSV
ncbi:DUF4269 domain-containing protein [Flavobacterium sp.]|uniref:DUF4269 domain-containing protein n=1 Tax=Flavobacterium sp. TaxID=239 RepID=UPI003A93447D